MRKVLVLFLILVFLVGCGTKTSVDLTTKPGSEEVVSTTPETATNVKNFNMTAKMFEFNPNKIVVNKGDKVIISIKSLDVEHGFAIDDYGVNEKIPAEGTLTVEFTADKIGLFAFYCSVYCGPGHGAMRGELLVVE